LDFGWSDKKKLSYFWATFINFNFLGPNLKNELGVNLQISKILRGQIIILEKFEGSICNFYKFIGVKLKIFENLRTKMQNLKNLTMTNFEILNF